MWLLRETGRAHTGFWWGDLRDRVHLEVPGLDRRKILKWIFKKWDGGAWTGLMWPRIGTSGGAVMTAVMNLWVP